MPYVPFRKKDQAASPYGRATDQGLIAACVGGEAAAWDELIRRYAALIYSTCLRMGVSQADTEDVFQNVCLILLNHLADLRDTAKLSGWLISTTKREAWRVLRRQGATLATDMGEGAWEMESAESVYQTHAGANPEADVIALTEQQLMREALSRLPDRCRDLLTLLYVTENPLSYQELSAKFSLPIGSIGPTRARCLQNLRKLLQELGY